MKSHALVIRRLPNIGILTFAIALCSLTINAAWGGLDPSFGTFGVYTEATAGLRASDIYIQGDGKILLTGYTEVTVNGAVKKRMTLRRYNADGGRDTTFGNNGIAVNNSLIAINADYRGYKITVLSNGTIVVIGSGNGSAMSWTFASGGTLTYTRSLSNFTAAGEIASIGNTAYVSATRNGDVCLIRLTSQGAQDMTFNGGGYSLTPFGPSNTTHALLAEADTGKLTIAGVLADGSVAVDRKFADGSNDGSLTSYVADTLPAQNPQAQPGLVVDLVRQNDGRYLVGYSRVVPMSVWDGYLSRFGPDGRFTDRFGGLAVGNVEFLGIQSNSDVVLGGYYRYYRWDSQFAGSEYFDSYQGAISNLYERVGALTANDKLLIVGRENGSGSLKFKRLYAN